MGYSKKKLGLEDIPSWNPLEFLGLFTLPLEIPDKILQQLLEIVGPSQNPWKSHMIFFLKVNENSTLFWFLIIPW